MTAIVTARLDQDNVRSLRRERHYISMRPVECGAAGVYGAHRSRHVRRVRRVEPASSMPKRLFDIVTGTAALLFLMPLLLTIAVLIKATSRGPVLFHQHRYGYRNRRFKIYKFRSMRTDVCDVKGVTQTIKGDARVTWIGRIIRKTSIDELPQLINVIKGDMSLVGPRPHVPGMLAAALPYEDLVPYYFQRHTARPGITGLAQVSGCRGSTVEAGRAISRIDYDLVYIEQWTLWMDIVIIARTVRREFLSGSGF